jgi:hypothetical protein
MREANNFVSKTSSSKLYSATIEFYSLLKKEMINNQFPKLILMPTLHFHIIIKENPPKHYRIIKKLLKFMKN